MSYYDKCRLEEQIEQRKKRLFSGFLDESGSPSGLELGSYNILKCGSKQENNFDYLRFEVLRDVWHLDALQEVSLLIYIFRSPRVQIDTAKYLPGVAAASSGCLNSELR